MLGLKWVVLLVAVGAAAIWIASGALRVPTAASDGRVPVLASPDTSLPGPARLIVQPQEDGDGERPGEDNRLPVQVWTVLAAGGAAALGLVLYLLRLAMGWVKPPPPPQEDSHH